LKLRCLKWARMTHLDIWNINYDQKKGWESNWQFDSWPLKVENRLDFLVCKQCAICHWKDLDSLDSHLNPLKSLGVHQLGPFPEGCSLLFRKKEFKFPWKKMCLKFCLIIIFAYEFWFKYFHLQSCSSPRNLSKDNS
jgi:hypothetical protein